MQSRCLTLYEPHHIACTETRERDSSRAETVFEETADKRNVVDNRRVRQPALFQQIPPECLGTTLRRSRSACSFLFAWDHAIPAQEVDKMPEGSSISSARSRMSSAIAQIKCRMIGADAGKSDPCLLKPSAKTRSEKNLSMNRYQAVSLLTYPSCKRTDLFRERAFRPSRQNHLVFDDALHGELLPRLCGLVEGVQNMSIWCQDFTRKERLP